MVETQRRVELASDNTAGICPEALAFLQEANRGSAPSYGDDQWTERICRRVQELFETDCDVFLVFNGTAANALALAHLGHSFSSVLCHQFAHLDNDECGACEFFSGGAKLIPVPGREGKLEIAALAEALARQHLLHSPIPRVISLTQATEMGTVYRPVEIAALSDFAKDRRILLHMDGARFANAIAALGCSPAEATWKAGISVLSFGGTKNGLAAGELVIFFSRQVSAEFDYRAKQGGQLASKMRFLAAPWLGLLEDNAWLRNAERANTGAAQLAIALEGIGFHPVFRVESNSVFIHLTKLLAEGLQKRGWDFYKFVEPDIYRLMCSWNFSSVVIEDFVRDLNEVNVCAAPAV